MSVIKKVEDILAWKEARSLAVSIYRLTSDGAWARDFGLRDQIRRASVSIACNIAEGYARETDIEFNRFLTIARGSANEVKTQLYIAHDLGYISEDTFQTVYASIDKICGMITNLMRYLKSAANDRPPTADRRQPTKKPRN